MNPAFAVLAVAVLGIDVGWQPLDEGGVEYIIQIEPDQVDRMLKFDDLISEVPKELDVRRYRITIGNEKLPRIANKTSPTNTAPAKEVIAEGAIPAAATLPESAKTKTPTPADVEEPTEATPVEPETPAASEGPELPATETTAQKPVTGTFAERDPAPRDEEGDESAPARSRTAGRPAASTERDDLFSGAGTRKSQLLDEPAEEVRPRLPTKSSRYAAEPADDDYEAQKPPAISSSLRTAQNTNRTSSSFDRETRDSESEWGPLVAIFFFLLVSMAANMWLGWVAWEARARYQVLLEKYRAAGGKPAMEVV